MEGEKSGTGYRKRGSFLQPRVNEGVLFINDNRTLWKRAWRSCRQRGQGGFVETGPRIFVNLAVSNIKSVDFVW